MNALDYIILEAETRLKRLAQSVERYVPAKYHGKSAKKKARNKNKVRRRKCRTKHALLTIEIKEMKIRRLLLGVSDE